MLQWELYLAVVSNFTKSSHAWIDRLKHWSYTCNFVAFHYNFLWGCNILAVIRCLMFCGILPVGSQNKEFNFRHDWNSLISDDETLQMRHYSRKYFPPADDYVSLKNIHGYSFPSLGTCFAYSHFPTPIFLLPYAYSTKCLYTSR